jgi:hypothetical protein
MSWLRVVFVAAAIVIAAGCNGSSPLAGPPVSGAGAVHLVSLAAGAHHAATLDVASGATSIEVGTANLSGRLITASTPLTSSQQPALAMSANGVAQLQLTSSGVGGVAGGPSIVDVALSSSVNWTINLDGGATEESVDMRGGHLTLLNLSAGTTRATIDLSARAGTQVVREIGGASELTVSVPPSVSSRVDVGGGAGSVTIGTVTRSGVGGDQTFSDPGYGTASRRLHLELQGGVSTVIVRHG